MGFHKRWITEEVLIDRYKRDGIEGIKSYLGHADAFVTSDELSHYVIDTYNSEKLKNDEKWKKISKKLKTQSRNENSTQKKR
jgi:tRNA(Phe) wybutosine-synthesizing methylase Tyw3